MDWAETATSLPVAVGSLARDHAEPFQPKTSGLDPMLPTAQASLGLIAVTAARAPPESEGALVTVHFEPFQRSTSGVTT
ncbi:MAG: hypothetical protein M0Z69_03275, partial [Actinomycetota bacterium]|nr:hypothetical protein [Actinomycetota bacterium]